MTKEPKFLVPIDRNGNHQSWDSRNDTRHVEPFEFTGTLTYKDFERGRSALNIVWEDQMGIQYRSGMYLLDSHLKKGGNHQITGTFTFKKQGTSVLLTLKK